MKLSLLAFLLLLSAYAYPQCQLIDGNGNMSANPVWVSCTGGNYTIFIQSTATFGASTIDWGDGSPVTNIPSLAPPAFITHTYTAAIANYTLTFNETSTGCTVTGLVVMEEPVNASIQIPVGGVTTVCAPADMVFTNSSTNVSSNTTFTWDFGDGSAPQTFGPANQGQNVTHTYDRNTVNCVTTVTLSAQNYCSFGNPTEASFNPVLIYDIDDAAIAATPILLCYPDTVVHFANATNKNCVPQGNTVQRFEYWNFGNYWGTGHDSIIDWQPFDPPARPGYDIAFPGVGTYTVMMIDSNMCGRDTAFTTVTISDPPTAGITANKDTICTGENITFTNTSFGGGNQHRIHRGVGGFQNIGASLTTSYNTPGVYTVRLVANITGGTAACTDTAEVEVVVLSSPNIDFSLGTVSGCDSVTTTITNNSTGGTMYSWTFGNGNTSALPNPPPQTFTNSGVSNITLELTNLNGCTATETQTVTVYDTPVASFTPQNVCEDVLATFQDNSTTGFGGPITNWAWSFGDAGNTTSSLQHPTFTYADSGTFQLELIVSTAHCADTLYDSIVVEPRPTASFDLDITSGCSPLTVSFTNNSIGATTYTWYFGDGNTSTQTDPAHTYVHNSLSDTTFFVKLVVSSAFGCQDSIIDTVTVLGNPIAQFSSNAVLDCAPLEVQFTNASTGATSYIWDFGDSLGSTVANPLHAFENQTLFITNYTTTLVAVGANGCTDTATDVITVFPQPLTSFNIVPASGCSPLEVQFPVAVGAVVYQWDFGDGATANGPSPTHTYVNNTTNNAQYTVKLIATSPFGCMDTVSGVVTVFPKPNASLLPLNIEGCNPLTVNFTNQSTGANAFQWDFDNGNTSATNATNVSHTFYNNINDTLGYNVSLIAITNDNCSDTAYSNVKVYRKVTAAFSAPDSGCHPLQASLTDQSLNAVSWDWDLGGGATSVQQNPSHTFTNMTLGTQVVNVSLEVENVEGCAHDTTLPVVVHPKPTAAMAPNVVVGCQPLQVDFTNSSSLVDTYTWNFGDGATSASGAPTVSHTFSNNTNNAAFFTTDLFVASIDGCLDTQSVTIEVHPQIIADFTIDTGGCHPHEATIANNSVNGANFSWDFGDGFTSNSASPQHTYNNLTSTAQVYTVTLQATNLEGCADFATATTTVFPKPIASFSSSITVGCEPLLVNFTNSSSLASSLLWVFGDGGSAATLAGMVPHTFYNPSNNALFRNIRQYVESVYGCRDTAQATIEIHPQIIAGFSVDTAGCHPFNAVFSDASVNASTYSWIFGDASSPSTSSNPVHQYLNTAITPVTYTATQTVSNAEGCQDQVSMDITVKPKPQSNFTVTTDPVCHRQGVTLANNSSQNLINYWQFTQSSIPVVNNAQQIDTNFLNFTSTPKQNIITLMVENQYGCLDTSSISVTVYPVVEALFSAPDEGCTPYEVHFTNISSGAPLFSWDFGDGNLNFDENPDHTFINPGTTDIVYNVVLTAISQYNCIDTMHHSILVHPIPEVSFMAQPQLQRFPDATVNFNNLTMTGPWDYLWSFGDGNTSDQTQVDEHTYETWGEYTIILKAGTEYCTDTAMRHIVIEPPFPVAEFSLDTSGCAPVTIEIINESEFGTAFYWDFGDGGQSSTEHPLYTFNVPGTYSIKLTAIGPAGDTSIKILENAVEVYDQAIANFDFNPKSVTVPNQPVNFFNYSQNATKVLWSFGDGESSTDDTPQHFYNQSGQFTPSLIADNEFGCADTLFADLPVTANEAGLVEVPNAFTPNPNGESSSGYDPFAQDNYVFFPIVSGVRKENYVLSIYNRWGELIFETTDTRQGWNGYYRGKICQQDVYVWKIQGEYVNGNKFSKVGDVTLLR